MKLAKCHPLLFLITGLVWLMLASVIGVALFLAMMLGHPLPAGLRHLHVHGALVGGVVQVIVGIMLAGRERSNSHPVLFAAINVGTIGMLLSLAVAGGFWLLSKSRSQADGRAQRIERERTADDQQ